jgi:ferredoxin-NADP reductase
MTELLSAPIGTAAGVGSELAGDDTELALVCRRTISVTHDVRTFVLEPLGSALLQQLPGQYLTITVSIDGMEVQRCYTVSSPPTRPGALMITVKRVPGGPVSNWLHDNLHVGQTLHAAGPFGRFTMADQPAPKYLFLSAGSGITPLMSMTRTLCDQGMPADVVFVHSARSPRDIIFRRELEAMSAAFDTFSVTAVCEGDSPLERWDGPRGRLSLELLRAVAPDLPDREVFTCGPPPYMEAVRAMLTVGGADPARCHEENFCFEAPGRLALCPDPTDTAAATDTAIPGSDESRPVPEVFTVELRSSGRQIECAADTTVLTAALRAGVDLPNSCAEGACGTCKSTLLGGRVDMQHAGGIRPREIAQDKFLPCCSKPLENLVIDR